ncbi:protein MEI2-like 6 [Macadamia integrifolia]|uniref:protein MEI2-like 6 n=1 Tax=Macadamia integrifolia TaxID=60698 RepID=UPI001C4FC63D|nr:protein MEI2-like 6 [Macadamia integrifolia]
MWNRKPQPQPQPQPLNPFAHPFWPSFHPKLPQLRLELPPLPPLPPPPFIGTSPTQPPWLHPPPLNCFPFMTGYHYYSPINHDDPPSLVPPAPTYVYSTATATATASSAARNITKERVESGLEAREAKKERVNGCKSRVLPADFKGFRSGFHRVRKCRRASIPRFVNHGRNPDHPLPPQTKASSSPPLHLLGCSVMIRHIPSKLSREMLIDLLDKHCIEENAKIKLGSSSSLSAYDFVYLPIDFRTGVNKGYAFVNFTSKEAADRFKTSFNGHKWHLFASKKICNIDDARIQGREGLVALFQRSKFPCDTDKYLPVQFSPPRNGSSRCPSPSVVGSISEKTNRRFFSAV